MGGLTAGKLTASKFMLLSNLPSAAADCSLQLSLMFTFVFTNLFLKSQLIVVRIWYCS